MGKFVEPKVFRIGSTAAVKTDPAKYQIGPEEAPKIWDWLHKRGGIQQWKSVDFSRPAETVTVPVHDPEGKLNTQPPHWRYQEKGRLISSPDEVEVVLDREVKRFRVAIRRGSQGLSWKVSDAGSRRIRREVEKAGTGAYYVFTETQEAVIMAPQQVTPLRDFMSQQETT